MPLFDDYPPDYRRAETDRILAAARAGECAAVVGLSGAGKSNLLGFIAHRLNPAGRFILVDGNRARPRTADGLLAEMARAVTSAASRAAGPAADPGATVDSSPLSPLDALERAVARALEPPGASLCLLLDRFDALDEAAQQDAAGPLRALRDAFKYRLAYVTAARRPPDPRSELAELFYANTLWLGPLTEADALWSARQYAARREAAFSEAQLGRLVALSWGYPSLLRACCEAAAGGCPLDLDALAAHPAVRRRVDEFWAGEPSEEDLRRSGLAGHPLLERKASAPTELTLLEHRLLGCLQARAGEVVEKDDLVRAVWPEDRVLDGLRDDSLAQLVRRVRQKIETDPSHPRRLLTVPGRGYRYQP